MNPFAWLALALLPAVTSEGSVQRLSAHSLSWLRPLPSTITTYVDHNLVSDDTTAWRRARKGALIGGTAGGLVGLGLAVAVCSTVGGDCRTVGVLASVTGGAAIGAAVGAFLAYELGRPGNAPRRLRLGMRLRPG
jgi:hypothetical protein